MHPAVAYWANGRGLGNITPAGKAWPEGDDFPRFLGDLLAGEQVVEFGCGTGRLAECFPAARYIGVDICRDVVAAARVKNPGHRFFAIDPGDAVPYGTAILAHTVLLHVPDDELAAVLAAFRSGRVVISEVMGRHWRRPGDPPVFNRDAADYIGTMSAQGYELAAEWRRPYPHYPGTDLTVLDFERAS